MKYDAPVLDTPLPSLSPTRLMLVPASTEDAGTRNKKPNVPTLEGLENTPFVNIKPDGLVVSTLQVLNFTVFVMVFDAPGNLPKIGMTSMVMSLLSFIEMEDVSMCASTLVRGVPSFAGSVDGIVIRFPSIRIVTPLNVKYTLSSVKTFENNFKEIISSISALTFTYVLAISLNTRSVPSIVPGFVLTRMLLVSMTGKFGDAM
jgi:hypothetical protein